MACVCTPRRCPTACCPRWTTPCGCLSCSSPWCARQSRYPSLPGAPRRWRPVNSGLHAQGITAGRSDRHPSSTPSRVDRATCHHRHPANHLQPARRHRRRLPRRRPPTHTWPSAGSSGRSCRLTCATRRGSKPWGCGGRRSPRPRSIGLSSAPSSSNGAPRYPLRRLHRRCPRLGIPQRTASTHRACHRRLRRTLRCSGSGTTRAQRWHAERPCPPLPCPFRCASRRLFWLAPWLPTLRWR